MEKSNLYLLIAIFAFVVLIGLYIGMGVRQIKFEQNCEGHLKRAADANSIELAERELQTALEYMWWKGYSKGYTSVIYRTPDEDVEFWYNNINSAYEELKSLPEDVTPLERTNVLMKLRETLTDEGETGVHITYPKGICNFPHNKFYFWMRALCYFMIILFGFGFLVEV